MRINKLSGNALKILGCLFMLCDHIGMILLQDLIILRVIGRLAFPIFAFFIAEGCKYTHNKFKYFVLILLMGIAFFGAQYFATGVVMLNIFLVFSCSILLIYILYFVKLSCFSPDKNASKIIISILLFFSLIAAFYILSFYVSVDYGFWGITLAVFFSLVDFSMLEKKSNIAIRVDNLYCKLLLGLICLVLVSITAVLPYEWVSIFSLPILLLYSGERGKLKLKYFFYIFYPVHIAILYGISMML